MLMLELAKLRRRNILYMIPFVAILLFFVGVYDWSSGLSRAFVR